jgi:hypothetical protein
MMYSAAMIFVSNAKYVQMPARLTLLRPRNKWSEVLRDGTSISTNASRTSTKTMAAEFVLLYAPGVSQGYRKKWQIG